MQGNQVQAELSILLLICVLTLVISCKPQVTEVPPGGVPAPPVCQGPSSGPNASASHVLSGKYFWDSTGTSTAGTMANRGTLNLTASTLPSSTEGYYASISLSLTNAEVCTSATLYGSAGTAICNSTVADLWASQACRADYATIDLTNTTDVATRPRAALADEVEQNSTYTSNHLYVPNPKYDTDGMGDDSGIGTSYRNYLVTVKGRPEAVCGLSGTVEARIADCLTQNGTKSKWEGRYYGQSGEGDWKLVTLYKSGASAGAACVGGSASGCYEVWRDERTKLLWSDKLGNNGEAYNWFRAAGYSSSATTVAVTGDEARAGVGTDCLDSGAVAQVCQPATPITACVDSSLIAGLNGVGTYQDQDGTNGTYDERPAKGNIAGTTAKWRLPTYGDWAVAFANGIAKVVPSMTGSTTYWTATSYSTDRTNAWVAGWSGVLFPSARDSLYNVRCVGGGE